MLALCDRPDQQKLSLFIQHRDPRYKAYQANQAQRKAAAKSKAPSAQTNQGQAFSSRPRSPIQEFEEQDWQKLRHSSDEEEDDMDAEEQAFECIACAKTFLSEASWSNHERSKKHKQAVFRYVLR